jgi:hypothetical protein
LEKRSRNLKKKEGKRFRLEEEVVLAGVDSVL